MDYVWLQLLEAFAKVIRKEKVVVFSLHQIHRWGRRQIGMKETIDW
jgi:hypothetical protein